MRKIGLFLLISLFVSATKANQTKNACLGFYQNRFSHLIPVGLVDFAAIEQTKNPRQPGRLQVDYSSIDYKTLDPKDVRTRWAASETIAGLLTAIVDAERILWLKNSKQPATDAIPYSFGTSDGSFLGLESSSRSLFFSIDDHWFSAKLPKEIAGEPGKEDLRKSVHISILRAQAIRKVDSLIGPDPELITLLDVLSVEDKLTGNGFIVRDLGPLQDGNLTTPGFAAEKYFKDYSRRSKPMTISQIRKSFAKRMGRSFAKMLLRYGLIMMSPHDQNYLVRFDPKTGAPLEQIGWRDLSDSQHFLAIMDAIGLTEFKTQTLEKDFSHQQMVNSPFMWNTWFLENYEPSVRQKMLLEISNEYFRFIYQQLNRTYTRKDFNEFSLTSFLMSSAGQLELRSYHARLKSRNIRL